ncbi:MAG: aminotransferase class V-fold PLP-dependent enzyme [Candidatus Cloacimonadota bacterium]
MDCTDLIRDLEWLRQDIIGRNVSFETPFGRRPLVYADYTASGRGLHSVERFITKALQYYANTHTEDDFTGKTMSQLLHEAEKQIKAAVNAGPKGKIIFTGSGTTGGITKLQQILGVYWPPATRERVNAFLRSCLDRNPGREDCNLALRNYMNTNKPIVFVGPYEHHSNEIMWRHTLCEIVEIPLAEDNGLDLAALEQTVSDPRYDNRLKIGSFSAASNVTGLKTDVYAVARILHRHKALACFDFAACAPYVQIDMNRDAESYFDAIFFSPHKFLGGPGSSGILIINEDIYDKKLPPTVAAGGTVLYVSPLKEEFIPDIESREKPGTPGILQDIRIALAMQVKTMVGQDVIDQIEAHYFELFHQAFKDEPAMVFYGPTELERKIPIIPFNIVHKDKVLHPKLVTRLLNDLFGIQSRAGCSCAGPYGHFLMKIEQKFSDYYRCMITNMGYGGIKPGWVRVNLHYSMAPEEINYLIDALRFICKYGHRFIPLYELDIRTGEWQHLEEKTQPALSLDLSSVLQDTQKPEIASEEPELLYHEALRAARELAETLPDEFEPFSFETELESLVFFYAHSVKGYHPVARL